MKAAARPGRLIAGTLFVLGLAAAVLTALQKLDAQGGGSLTALLAILAAVTAFVEKWIRDRGQGSGADTGLGRQVEAARRDLLAEVRRIWLPMELDRSASSPPYIELDLVERPGAVRGFPHAAVKQLGEVDRPLERGLDVRSLFHQLGRRLLVLGDPGTGKTTLLLELTRTLLDAAEADPSEPVPVVFPLSAWAIDRRSLADWMVEELERSYGVTRRLGRLWIDTDQVIPMLDGLDEVARAYRDQCVAAINGFRVEHGQLPLVVCSRTEEYERLRAKLELRGAVVIQPLIAVEVDRYLREVGTPLAGLRTVLRQDKQLRELLTTPLLLRFVVSTYRSRSAAALKAAGSADERRKQVLSDYVESRLERSVASGVGIPWSREQTVSWLAWLARAMRVHGQSLFHLDWLQPDWLPRRLQRRAVSAGIAAAIGLVVAVGLAPLAIWPIVGVFWITALGLGTWALVAMGPWTPRRLVIAVAAGVGIARLGQHVIDPLGVDVFVVEHALDHVSVPLVNLDLLTVAIGPLPSVVVASVGLVAWMAGRVIGPAVRPIVILVVAVIIATVVPPVVPLGDSVPVGAAVGLVTWAAAGLDVRPPVRVFISVAAAGLVGLVASLTLPSFGTWLAVLLAAVAAGAARTSVMSLGASSSVRLVLAVVAGAAAYFLTWELTLWPNILPYFGDDPKGPMAAVIPLAGGAAVGLSAYGTAVAPTSRLRWSWAALGRRLPKMLVSGALVGVVVGVGVGLITFVGFLIDPHIVRPVSGLGRLTEGLLNESGFAGVGLVAGLACGIGLGAMAGLDAGMAVTPVEPGEGIRTSARNAAVGGLASLVVSAFAVLLSRAAFDQLHSMPVARWLWAALDFLNRPEPFMWETLWALIALVIPLAVALRLGGGAYLRHHAVRALLAAAGAAPADFAGFLEHASRLVLLRRRGGGYEFLHRLLQEHYAILEQEATAAEGGICQPFRDTGC